MQTVAAAARVRFWYRAAMRDCILIAARRSPNICERPLCVRPFTLVYLLVALLIEGAAFYIIIMNASRASVCMCVSNTLRARTSTIKTPHTHMRRRRRGSRRATRLSIAEHTETRCMCACSRSLFTQPVFRRIIPSSSSSSSSQWSLLSSCAATKMTLASNSWAQFKYHHHITRCMEINLAPIILAGFNPSEFHLVRSNLLLICLVDLNYTCAKHAHVYTHKKTPNTRTQSNIHTR